ncbi:chromosome segregation protein SMC, partial [Desulfosarcina sp. OttesenSCG-928-G17]|nr:chromosome segregation protein SMC [Desulfosarcina sp. OttesenSCG-928-G17]
KTDGERRSGEIVSLKTARSLLATEIDRMKAEMDAASQEHIRLGEEIEGLRSAISHENIDSAALRDTLEQVNKAVETEKNELMRLVAEEARLKSAFQSATDAHTALKRRLARTAEEMALSEKAVQETAAQLDYSDAEYRQMKAEIAEWETTAANFEQEGKGISEKLSALDTAIRNLEMDHHAAASRLDALEQMEKQREGYWEGVKAVLGAAENADSRSSDEEHPQPLNGIMGILADGITPDPGWETAVEAALGDALQYVWVRDVPSGINALDFLKKNKAGRCGFIPLDKGWPSTAPIVADAKDLLLSHIQIKPEFEPVVRSLLSHIKTTDTVEAAWASGFSPEDLKDSTPMAVVTPDGDMISSQGMIIGGGTETHTGLLTRKREIRTLSETCGVLDTQIKTASGEQEQLTNALQDIRHQLDVALAEKENAIQDAREAEKRRYQAETELKTNRRRLEVVTLEQEQLMGEEVELEESAHRYQTLLKTLSGRIQETQSEMDQKATQIREIRQEMEDFEKRIVDLKLELTTLSANRDNADSTRRQLKNFHDDALGRLAQMDADTAEKTEEQVQAEERRKILEQKLADDQKKVKALNHQVQEDDETLKGFEAELSQHHTAAQECRLRQAAIQDQIRALDVELAENRINRENLENRSQEYYHCAISDLPPPDPADQKKPDDVAEMETKLSDLRKKMGSIGDVNLEAIALYEEQKTRHDFLCGQRDDLNKAIEGLHQVIRQINKTTRTLFLDTFTKINEKLQVVFPQLFQGGSACLELTRPDDPLESGVEFMVSPPGKKLTRMSLLSGGEKALAAISFIFSIFLLRPASFCLMDEIDAPLDDANVVRFNNLMKTIGEKSQIIMITHNKSTMAFADTLFGITMEQNGLSRVVSVRLEGDREE